MARVRVSCSLLPITTSALRVICVHSNSDETILTQKPSYFLTDGMEQMGADEIGYIIFICVLYVSFHTFIRTRWNVTG
jgi:hypothetical protein